MNEGDDEVSDSTTLGAVAPFGGFPVYVAVASHRELVEVRALTADEARILTHCGISVIPIKAGDKCPTVAWKPFQDHIATDDELIQMFANEGGGIAAVCGPISGGLELMDFDVPGKPEKTVPPAWKPFCTLLIENGYEDLLKRLIITQTPSGGRHLVYRCPEVKDGNQKLAQTEDSKALIETRGVGGYFVIPPTPKYILKQGSFDSIPIITQGEREMLHCAARLQNRLFAEPVRTERNYPSGRRPGDDYTLRGESFDELIMRHGWKPTRKSGPWRCFTRPDKHEGISAGISESTGYFHVFTTSTKFEAGRGYSKFSAYVILEHGGDVNMAARTLKEQGYGGDGYVSGGGRQYSDYEQPPDYVGMDEDDGPVKMSTVTPESYKWLWEGYILRCHFNLIEGFGGAMKSTLQLGIAMQGSIGREPLTGKPIEKFRTLYIARQDTRGEIATILQRLGADMDYIDVYDKYIELDGTGLKRLAEWQEAGDYELIMLDPIKGCFPRWVKNEFDNIALNKFFDSLRDVAKGPEIAITGTRHFSKATQGKRLEGLAAGGEEWRNSSRRQLVGFHAPDKSYQAVYFSGRGSMNSAAGAPFGIDFRHGQFSWVPEDAIDFDWYADKYPAVADFLGIATKAKGGRAPDPEREKADGYFAVLQATDEPMYLSDAFEWAKANGVDKRDLYNAAMALGMKVVKTSENRKIWEVG